MNCRKTCFMAGWLQFLLLFCCAVSGIVPVYSTTTTQISQFGITWAFSAAVEYGQYVNGDYWIIGPAEVTEITPLCEVIYDGYISRDRVVHGSMINPEAGLKAQGYDDSRSSSYDAALNAALTFPFILNANESLVSCISALDRDHSNDPYLQSAAVLTCVSSHPPAGSFRPSYSNPDKSPPANQTDLTAQYSLLKSIPVIAGNPDLSSIEALYERPWIDHYPQWVGRYFHPTENMSAYGRELARDVGYGAIFLHFDYTLEEKETLLIRYIQLGLDLYGILVNGGETCWISDGGHGQGRKWPVLFAGLMLNDQNILQAIERTGDYADSGGYGPGNLPDDFLSFQEDMQCFHVTGEDIDRTHDSSWNPDERHGTGIPYEKEDVGMPEWGIRHYNGSYNNRDNKDGDAIYRGINQWHMHALAALIMDAKTAWNHDASFDFLDRRMIETLPGGYFTSAGNPDVTHTVMRSWSSWQEDVWDALRDDYTPYPYPDNLDANFISQNQINLYWSDNCTTEDGYLIERSTDRGKNYTQAGSVGADVTSFSDMTVTSDTEYYYRVVAYNSHGNSAPAWKYVSAYCDLNGDAAVNVVDVQACVNHILGLQDWGAVADINNDGSVNVVDLQMIVNEILGPSALR